MIIRWILALTIIFSTQVCGEDKVIERVDAGRQSTGGAQNLDDILARQKGLKLNDKFRSGNLGDPNSAAATTESLGTLGGVSSSDIFRSLRYNKADVNVSNRNPAADVLFQDAGMSWLEVRRTDLPKYGGLSLVGVIILLGIFYILRGPIMIEGGASGETIQRFKAIERFGHWLLAGSFILLGLTGIITLVGRMVFIPIIGHEAFSVIAIGSKWIHNNVSWAFMLGLVMTFCLWVRHNIPNKLDLIWLSKGGGLFSKHSHPSAKKFNAGQKIVFWMVMILGGSVSASGLSLLFPFEFPMFAKTFALINSTQIPVLFGFTDLPTTLLPHEEMQYAHVWHSIVAFVMMAAIMAHIYIGSVGMEGAYDAMGDGNVDLEWAKQHHDLWVEEVENQKSPSKEESEVAFGK